MNRYFHELIKIGTFKRLVVQQTAFTYTMSVLEKERQQSISGNHQGGSEDSTGSPTNRKGSESQDDKVETEPEPESESENTMANLLFSKGDSTQCRTIENEPKLKLIVRSQYWGRELKGRTCRNVYTKMNNKAPLVVTSQAVLYNTNNTDGFWGCCPNHGKRVLELQEFHFSDVCKGWNWDLYLVGSWVSPSQCIHDFFLLPQNQTSVDIERNVRLNGWSYFGTCNPGMIRSGIDDLLRDMLLQNDAYGNRYHHAHIDIMMDKAFDRETPRSRKISNEKSRAERKSQNYDRQESSVTTDATASTEQESEPPPATVENTHKSIATKVIGAVPPIPRFISNDGPYLVQVPQSMGNPMVGYQDARWTGETTHWNQNQFSVPSHSGFVTGQSGQVLSGGEQQGLYWYPAKGIPLPGGMAQQPSYWHNPNGAQFATAPPHPYYLPDVQMHQYQVEVQHAHYSMPFSENLYYNGVNTTPERSFGVEPSMIFREVNEGANIGSFPYPVANVSTSDCSVSPPPPQGLGSTPPDIPSASIASNILDIAKVSPITATHARSIVSSDHSGVSPQASSVLSDTTVRDSPSNTASNAELGGISTPGQLLISTEDES